MPEEEEGDLQLCVDLWQRSYSSKHLSHQPVRPTQGGVDLGANTCTHIDSRSQAVLHHQLPKLACPSRSLQVTQQGLTLVQNNFSSVTDTEGEGSQSVLSLLESVVPRAWSTEVKNYFQ